MRCLSLSALLVKIICKVVRTPSGNNFTYCSDSLNGLQRSLSMLPFFCHSFALPLIVAVVEPTGRARSACVAVGRCPCYASC